MTIIKANCPNCAEPEDGDFGDLDLDEHEIILVVWNKVELSTYSFFCYRCHEQITKPADGDVISLLVLAGVIPQPRLVPDEAMEEHRGAPINKDDILDFVLAFDACEKELS